MRFLHLANLYSYYYLALRLFITVAIVLLTAVFQVVSAQEIEARILTQIDKIIKWETPIDSIETPGFIIGIIEPDTTFIISKGKSANHMERIERTSTFALGGLSKIYIALLYQDLIKTNQIQDEIELQEIFPRLKNSPWQSVNLYQLLTHQSGIPRALKEVNTEQEDPFESIKIDDILEGLASTPLRRKRNFLYSHYNYALLAAAIEKITSKEIEELWTSCINCRKLRPSLKTDHDHITFAPGLDKSGRVATRLEYGAMTYSLGLYGTIDDLVNIVRHLNNLDESLINLDTERINTKIDKNIKFSRGLYVLTGERKYTVFTHSGRTSQHSAAIHCVPETNTGVVIVSNSEIGTKDLSLRVLRMVNKNWKRKRIKNNE